MLYLVMNLMVYVYVFYILCCIVSELCDLYVLVFDLYCTTFGQELDGIHDHYYPLFGYDFDGCTSYPYILSDITPTTHRNYKFVYYCGKCGDSGTIDWERLGTVSCPCSEKVHL